jgi:hypothetical protein
MDPEIIALSTQLAETAIRNTASAISDKITAAKARRKDHETIAELEEIVSDLISDKNNLVRIAQVYEQELVAQRISQDDVRYITHNIVPIVERLIEAGPTSDGQNPGLGASIDAAKSLLSVETVNILQLIGFNFKRAVGEPLTDLVATLISSRVPPSVERATALQETAMEREIAYIGVARDPESYARFRELFGQPNS